MSEGLDELKRAYRETGAPSDFRAGVMAAIDGRSTATQTGWQTWAATAAALALFALLPVTLLDQTPESQSAASFSRVSELMNRRPEAALPSLSRLRSVPTPVLPARPSAGEPDSASVPSPAESTTEHRHEDHDRAYT